LLASRNERMRKMTLLLTMRAKSMMVMLVTIL
jgi:hypothetical protein